LKKPSAGDSREIRRLILEKLVLGRNWGMNYLSYEDIPKGLPKAYSKGWYYDEIDNMVKDSLLLKYKKRFYRLNIQMKPQIEVLIGKVPPKT